MSLSSLEPKYKLLINKKINDKIEFPEDKYQTNKEERKIENILSLESYINWKAHDSFFSLSKQGRWDAGVAIEVPNDKKGGVDVNNVINFIKDQQGKSMGFFNDYCLNNYPFAFLALSEGGVANAIGRITNENKGFIRFSDGTIQETNKQRGVAEKIITGSEVFLDGTTALFLAETDLLKKIKPFIPNLKVPQSVINFLFKTLEKFNITPGQVGHMGCANDRLVANKIDKEKNKRIKSNFKQSIEILEKDKNSIFPISQANKSEHFSESNIAPELTDACILAQKNKASVMTEDFLYLQVNKLQTKKDTPEYCSLFFLAKELLEQKKISFDDYLNIFSYLSSYRCRFLDLNADLMIKSVFGEIDDMKFEPQKLHYLNLNLTLSEEYGVKAENAINVLSEFISRVIVANIVTLENVKEIYKIVLIPFLFKGKRDNCLELLEKCKKMMGKYFERYHIQFTPAYAEEKILELERQLKEETKS